MGAGGGCLAFVCQKTSGWLTRASTVCSIFFSAKECLDETLSELELSENEEVMEQLNK